eukprot:scaffold7377_cov389-Prasinococcus_capsulatus_cf.AAC.22
MPCATLRLSPVDFAPKSPPRTRPRCAMDAPPARAPPRAAHKAKGLALARAGAGGGVRARGARREAGALRQWWAEA